MSSILLIEDDQATREMLCKALIRSGHSVIEASDGSQVLQVLGEQHVDLIITDIIMPGKEGLELILELGQVCPEIPIIAISGGGRLAPSIHLKLARASGAAGVFEKPLDLNAFLSEVQKLLSSPGCSDGKPISN